MQISGCGAESIEVAFIGHLWQGTGKPVENQHVAGQLWYEPRKDFTMESLTKTQMAAIKRLDDRIAAVPK